MLGLGAAHADRLRQAASRSAQRVAAQQPLRRRTDATAAGAVIEDASTFLDCFVDMLNENAHTLLEPPYRAVQRRNAARGTSLPLDSSAATALWLQMARFDVASALRRLTCVNRQFRDAARTNKKLAFLLAYYAHVPTRLYSDQNVDNAERDAMWILDCGVPVRDRHRLMDRLPAPVQRALLPVHENCAHEATGRIAPVAGYTGTVDPHTEAFAALPRAAFPRQRLTEEVADVRLEAAARAAPEAPVHLDVNLETRTVLAPILEDRLRMLPGFQRYTIDGLPEPPPPLWTNGLDGVRLLDRITPEHLIVDRFHTAAQLEFNEDAAVQAYYLRFAATDEDTVPKDLKPAVRAWIGRMRYAFLRSRLQNFWCTATKPQMCVRHGSSVRMPMYGMPHMLVAAGVFGSRGVDAGEDTPVDAVHNLALGRLPPTHLLTQHGRHPVAPRAIWCWRRFHHHLANAFRLEEWQRDGPAEHGVEWADVVSQFIESSRFHDAMRLMNDDVSALTDALDNAWEAHCRANGWNPQTRSQHPNARGLPADAPADPAWLDTAPDADGRVGLGMPPDRDHQLFGPLRLRACAVPQCSGHCDWDAHLRPGTFEADPPTARDSPIGRVTMLLRNSAAPFDNDATWGTGAAAGLAKQFRSPIMDPCDKGAVSDYVALAGGAPLLDTAGATRLVPNVSFCSLACRMAAARALVRHQLRSLAVDAPPPSANRRPSANQLAELQLALHRGIYVKLMGFNHWNSARNRAERIHWSRAEPPVELRADTYFVPEPHGPGARKCLFPPSATCAVSRQALLESRDREITMMNVHLGVLVAAATVERSLRLAQGLSQSELEAAATSPLTLPHGVNIPGINSRIEHFCRTPVFFTHPVRQVAAVYERYARHVSVDGVSPVPLCVDIERRSQPEWLREVVALAAQGHIFGQVV